MSEQSMNQEERNEMAYVVELALEAIQRYNRRHPDNLMDFPNQAHYIVGYLSGQYLPVRRMTYGEKSPTPLDLEGWPVAGLPLEVNR